MWPAGLQLARIYDPALHGATALGFRSPGPFARFDHHVGGADRGITYAAERLSGSLVEVAGDTGICYCGTRRYTRFAPTRELRLLDLSVNGVRQAGTIAKVTSCEHTESQPWARYFYENPDVYGALDGLYYPNAHNFEMAIALFERARDAMPARPLFDRKLWSRVHMAELLLAGELTNIAVYR